MAYTWKLNNVYTIDHYKEKINRILDIFILFFYLFHCFGIYRLLELDRLFMNFFSFIWYYQFIWSFIWLSVLLDMYKYIKQIHGSTLLGYTTSILFFLWCEFINGCYRSHFPLYLSFGPCLSDIVYPVSLSTA